MSGAGAKVNFSDVYEEFGIETKNTFLAIDVPPFTPGSAMPPRSRGCRSEPLGRHFAARRGRCPTSPAVEASTTTPHSKVATPTEAERAGSSGPQQQLTAATWVPATTAHIPVLLGSECQEMLGEHGTDDAEPYRLPDACFASARRKQKLAQEQAAGRHEKTLQTPKLPGGVDDEEEEAATTRSSRRRQLLDDQPLSSCRVRMSTPFPCTPALDDCLNTYYERYGHGEVPESHVCLSLEGFPAVAMGLQQAAAVAPMGPGAPVLPVHEGAGQVGGAQRRQADAPICPLPAMPPPPPPASMGLPAGHTATSVAADMSTAPAATYAQQMMSCYQLPPPWMSQTAAAPSMAPPVVVEGAAPHAAMQQPGPSSAPAVEAPAPMARMSGRTSAPKAGRKAPKGAPRPALEANTAAAAVPPGSFTGHVAEAPAAGMAVMGSAAPAEPLPPTVQDPLLLQHAVPHGHHQASSTASGGAAASSMVPPPVLAPPCSGPAPFMWPFPPVAAPPQQMAAMYWMALCAQGLQGIAGSSCPPQDGVNSFAGGPSPSSASAFVPSAGAQHLPMWFGPPMDPAASSSAAAAAPAGPIAAYPERPVEVKNKRNRSARLWVHIYLHMDAKDFDLVPRLIGRGGCNTKSIFEATGAKLRIRGRGSGHMEVDGKAEAAAPLMVAITSDEHDDDSFVMAVRLMVKDLRTCEQRYIEHCQRMGYRTPGAGFSVGPSANDAKILLADVLRGVPCHTKR